jgi:branched-chain amino acid transport system ATP-binding protein
VTDVPLLELEGVRAAYGGIEVLHGIDLVVHEGSVVALLGPNGAGKSTILKVCAGQLEPTAGEVRVAGRLVNGAPADALARLGMCTIPEGRGIFPNLTVRENLWMDTLTGMRLSDVEEVAYVRFPLLADRRRQLAGTLSARALTTDPALLLLDELSMGLAPLVVARLYETVAQLSADGVSILVSEQFARTVLGIAHVAAIVANGTVVRVGPPGEVESELSAAYLGA